MQDFKILVFMLRLMLCPSSLGYIKLLRKGAKKVSCTACHSGKLKLACTSPKFISASPKNVLMRRTDYKVFK